MSFYDFDVTLGMNWLSKYHVTVNHFTKEVVLKLSDYKKSDIPGSLGKELIVYTLLGEFRIIRTVYWNCAV